MSMAQCARLPSERLFESQQASFAGRTSSHGKQKPALLPPPAALAGGEPYHSAGTPGSPGGSAASHTASVHCDAGRCSQPAPLPGQASQGN